MKLSKKEMQEMRETEIRHEFRWNNSLAGKLHKKHKEVFGVEPKFFGATGIGSDDYLNAIRNAIRNGKPLDQYAELPPEVKEEWKMGLIEID